MKRITTVLFILIALVLFFNKANAQAETILTSDSLPYTLDQPLHIVGLNVNGNEELEFILLLYNLDEENTEMFGTIFLSLSPYGGILSEDETVPLPYESIPDLNNFPPLSFPQPTREAPYVSLFPQGVRIENRPPNIESTWSEISAIAGFPFLFSNEGNITPPESSYIDGLSSGYIGARYELDGEMYYGWIEISVDDSAPSVTIESMAFETIPDRRSYTGTMPVVPIAFISSLIGFFAIGIGVYFRRRKK
ncbi:MAG: hypothetical protein JXR50_03895 [Prolixibacteraceae bacterium]|nr:hypothetical protein [Prolixibacteraceae bacterium]MBN2648866.1 hypothetical protein [Prolixibacteraceae bacterium]